MKQTTPRHVYAIGIGSNRPHPRHGRPPGVVAAGIAALDAAFSLFDASPILINPALGPGGRDYANAAALVESALSPPDMLEAVKVIEAAFGRRRGRRWGPRVIDLDILAWDGGRWRSRSLTIPHGGLAERAFALLPLAAIAPAWRVHGALTPRHLAHRLGKRGARP